MSFQLDPDQVRLREFEGEEGRFLLWSSLVEPPESIKVQLVNVLPIDRVSWQKLLLDVHRVNLWAGLVLTFWM